MQNNTHMSHGKVQHFLYNIASAAEKSRLPCGSMQMLHKFPFTTSRNEGEHAKSASML